MSFATESAARILAVAIADCIKNPDPYAIAGGIAVFAFLLGFTLMRRRRESF